MQSQDSARLSPTAWLAFAFGCTAHLLQILLMREAYALGYPGEIGFTLLMLCWLLGSSLGALAVTWVPGFFRRPGVILTGMVVSCLAGLVSLRWLYAVGLEASRISPGLGELLLIGFLVCLLPSAGAGAALTVLLLRVPEAGRPRIFAADCLGACLVGVVLSAGFSADLSPLPESLRASLWERALPGARLLRERDLPDARLALLERSGMVVAYSNGRLAGWIPATEDERGHALTCLSLVPAPRRVLVLAGSLGAYLGSLLEEGAGEVTLVARDRVALEVLGEAAPELGESLKDPRVRVAEVDPRVFLRDQAAASFDLVLLPTAHPGSASENRLFTREALTQIARVLSPEGYLVVPLPTHPAGQVSPGAVAARSVFRALEAAFPGGVDTFGSSPVMVVAGHRAPDLDPVKMAERFPESSLGPDLVYHLEQVLDPGEREAGRKSLAQVEARENRDQRPWAYGAAMAARLVEDTTSRERGIAALVLCLATGLGILAVARRVGARPGLGAVSSGLVAMLAWGASLYLFQLARGALYREIGLVGAVCLLGLALGASWRGAERTRLALLGTGLGLLGVGRMDPGNLAALLALACGGLGSFAAGQIMARLLREHPEHPGALEAGDLLGAALGSLLVSGVILTGPGPDVAAVLMGILALVLGGKAARR